MYLSIAFLAFSYGYLVNSEAFQVTICALRFCIVMNHIKNPETFQSFKAQEAPAQKNELRMLIDRTGIGF